MNLIISEVTQILSLVHPYVIIGSIWLILLSGDVVTRVIHVVYLLSGHGIGPRERRPRVQHLLVLLIRLLLLLLSGSSVIIIGAIVMLSRCHLLLIIVAGGSIGVSLSQQVS